MVDREQTRRDAHLIASRDHWRDRALKAEAELEQAERERDEAIQQKNAAMILANNGFAEKDARLAKVPALVEALQRLADVNTDDVIRDAAFHRRIARDALAAWEQE